MLLAQHLPMRLWLFVYKHKLLLIYVNTYSLSLSIIKLHKYPLLILPTGYSALGRQRKNFMNDLIKWLDEKITFLKQNEIMFVDGMPAIPKEALYTGIPDMIETYAHRHSVPHKIRSKTLLSYFDNDDNLINRLFKIDDEIKELKLYGGICGFDLSPCITMLRPRQKISLMVCAVFNCYLALQGIKVLPNCRVGDLTSMSLIDTIPPYTNIISGELGCHKSPLKMYGIYQLRLITKKVCPEILFIYGNLSKKDIQYIFGRRPQIIILYPDHRHRVRDRKKAIVTKWDGVNLCKIPLSEYLEERGAANGR